MDYIELNNMTFYAFHGVLEQERIVGNTFRVDLKLYLNLSEAIRSDNLDDTLNYATVFDLVKKEMTTPSRLIEHVAGRILQRIGRAFPSVKKAEIRLAKTNPPVAGQVEEAAVGITMNYEA
jgi:dihydroneopterin aldolase